MLSNNLIRVSRIYATIKVNDGSFKKMVGYEIITTAVANCYHLNTFKTRNIEQYKLSIERLSNRLKYLLSELNIEYEGFKVLSHDPYQTGSLNAERFLISTYTDDKYDVDHIVNNHLTQTLLYLNQQYDNDYTSVQ